MKKLLTNLGAGVTTILARKTPCTSSPKTEPLNRIDERGTSPADVVASLLREGSAPYAVKRRAIAVMGFAKSAASLFVRLTAFICLAATAGKFGFANHAMAPLLATAPSVNWPELSFPHLSASRMTTKHPDLPQLIQDLLYAEDRRLLDDPIGRAIRQVIDAGVADDFVTGMLKECVGKDRIAQAFAGPFRLPHLEGGEITLGLDAKHRPCRIPLQYLNAHSLTTSGSGGGKTFRSRWLALQIAPQIPGIWLFDLRKREMAILQPLLARLGIEVFVVPARMLRLNPLQIPPGVDPREWASRVADLLVQVLHLPARADKLLHSIILELFDQAGVLHAR